MKRTTALICLLLFSNLAVAHPFASGGGSSSSSSETNLSVVITVIVVAGVAALLVTDIITDNANDSQDAISGIEEGILTEDTGVNWGQFNGDTEQSSIPLLAVSVFPGDNGRDLSTYFSNLLTQGNDVYFNLYSSPVSFGQMQPLEAAKTGFSFLDCQMFVAAASSGLELYGEDSDTPIWFFNTTEWDSVVVSEAASSFIEFSRNN